MPAKKKVLLFIDWYRPGFKAGGPVRSMVNMIEALSGEVEFHVVTRNADYTEDKPYPGIASDQWVEGLSGEKVWYFSKEKLNRKNIRQLILSSDADKVYINGIYSWFFSILPLLIARRKKGMKILVAARGMFAPSAIGVKSAKKNLFLNLAKFSGIYKNVVLHATNPEEEQHIREALGREIKIEIAPNFSSAHTAVQRSSPKKKGELNIVCVARIAPEKNILFALECLNYKVDGLIRLDIFGPSYDGPYFKKCLELAERLPNNVSVHFKGALAPENFSETMTNYDLFFLPTRGENFGHAILEAMSCGLPVLISDQTPWRDLSSAFAGQDLALEISLFQKEISNWLNRDNEDYQKFRSGAISLSTLKKDTPSLRKRYLEFL